MPNPTNSKHRIFVDGSQNDCALSALVLGLILDAIHASQLARNAADAATRQTAQAKLDKLAELFNSNAAYHTLYNLVATRNPDFTSLWQNQSLTKAQKFSSFINTLLQQPSGLLQIQGRIAPALRALVAQDIQDKKGFLIDDDVDENTLLASFIAAFRQYAAEKLNVAGEQDADVTFKHINTITPYFDSLLKNYPRSNLDDLCNAVEDNLIRYWQTTGFDLYHNYVATDGKELCASEIVRAAQLLQISTNFYEAGSLATTLHGKPTVLTGFAATQPQVTLVQVPGHFDIAVSDDMLASVGVPESMQASIQYRTKSDSYTDLSMNLQKEINAVFDNLLAAQSQNQINETVVKNQFEAAFDLAVRAHKQAETNLNTGTNIHGLFASYKNQIQRHSITLAQSTCHAESQTFSQSSNSAPRLVKS